MLPPYLFGPLPENGVAVRDLKSLEDIAEHLRQAVLAFKSTGRLNYRQQTRQIFKSLISVVSGTSNLQVGSLNWLYSTIERVDEFLNDTKGFSQDALNPLTTNPFTPLIPMGENFSRSRLDYVDENIIARNIDDVKSLFTNTVVVDQQNDEMDIDQFAEREQRVPEEGDNSAHHELQVTSKSIFSASNVRSGIGRQRNNRLNPTFAPIKALKSSSDIIPLSSISPNVPESSLYSVLCRINDMSLEKLKPKAESNSTTPADETAKPGKDEQMIWQFIVFLAADVFGEAGPVRLRTFLTRYNTRNVLIDASAIEKARVLSNKQGVSEDHRKLYTYVAEVLPYSKAGGESYNSPLNFDQIDRGMQIHTTYEQLLHQYNQMRKDFKGETKSDREKFGTEKLQDSDEPRHLLQHLSNSFGEKQKTFLNLIDGARPMSRFVELLGRPVIFLLPPTSRGFLKDVGKARIECVVPIFLQHLPVVREIVQALQPAWNEFRSGATILPILEPEDNPHLSTARRIEIATGVTIPDQAPPTVS